MIKTKVVVKYLLFNLFSIFNLKCKSGVAHAN